MAIKHFLKPIDDLTLGADSIGHGNLSHRVEIRPGDELGQLADAFNKMATDLQMTTVSRDYVESILETMLDALIVVAADGHIITTNRAACLMLGYNREELLGLTVYDLVAADVHQVIPGRLEELYSGKTEVSEYPARALEVVCCRYPNREQDSIST